MRLLIQTLFSALTNGYVYGFINGTVFKGWSKQICVPGLNCYACPGALGSCPIGALQAVAGGRNMAFSHYVVGFLVLFGSLFGRFACGFLCPFGLLQDLLNKIPAPFKRKSLPGHRYLKYLKYAVLAVFVIIMPLAVVDIVGQGAPAFCKYVCPSGTLSGWILLSRAEKLRGLVGWLFGWKSALLVAILLGSVLVYRPFCKYLCPLGAAYALFNRVSALKLTVGEGCTRCGKCARACKMDIDPVCSPGSAECIRCMECARACPHGAIHFGMFPKRKSAAGKAEIGE